MLLALSGAYSLWAAFGVVGLVIFVLPTVLAAWKRHRYFWIIAAVNFGGGIVAGLLFGRRVAGLGWLAAVILVLWPAERSDIDWSVRSTAAHPVGPVTPQQDHVAEGEELEPGPPPATKTCPDCAEVLPAEAPICRACFHRFEGESGVA